MAKQWEDIGDGKWKLTVSPDEGGTASVYYGTRDEILDKLADSQANANGRIDKLRSANGNGHPAAPAIPPPSQPTPLTANERMQVVADLSNPASVDRGVTRVIESVIGPVSEFRRDREAERAERIEESAVAAATQFAEETPEFYPSDYNNNTLVGYMQNIGLNPTDVSHYKRAFAHLTAAKLLQPKPAASETPIEPEREPQERNAPAVSSPRPPARYSTGVRASDISGTAPVPSKRLKYTREQITNMSAATYKANMSDPEFVRCVEFYAQPRRRTAAAV